MNGSFFIGLNSPHQTATCLLLIGWLFVVASHSQAQSSNSSFLIDFTREGAWRYTNQPETKHQTNGRVIQQQLTHIGKRLNHLSVVDPPVYVQLQGELQTYLQGLDEQHANYGDISVYQSVLLRFTHMDEQVKAALSNGRWMDMQQVTGQLVTDSLQDALVKSRILQLRPYAILFRRADFRSKVVHIATAGEMVSLLKKGGSYQYVQCGKYKGYLGTGMIVGWMP